MLEDHPMDNSLSPSQIINKYWEIYNSSYKTNNALNGVIFENLAIIALASSGIKNIYYQTELTFVPSAIFDIFLYNENRPIVISVKTSLRERWKQADLEALAIKQVHKNAKCYLLTLSINEVRVRRERDENYAGLDGFILANTEEFDQFVESIKDETFTLAGEFPIVKNKNNIYTLKKINEYFNLNIIT